VSSSGVIEECYQLAQDYSARACTSLDLLPANSARKSLKELAQYVVARKK
jgi:geranylgeranyl pyrophosphate synthase